VRYDDEIDYEIWQCWWICDGFLLGVFVAFSRRSGAINGKALIAKSLQGNRISAVAAAVVNLSEL
jgi:hypothetical protein